MTGADYDLISILMVCAVIFAAVTIGCFVALRALLPPKPNRRGPL